MSPYLLVPFWVTLASLLLGDGQATILFAGDAMMHKGQIAAAKQPDGSYAYDDCFAQLAPVISAADYAVVNLETPLGGAPYSGYPCFCAPDSYAEALQNAGFDMMLTANNHTLDRRDQGLKRTIHVLNDKSIDHLGTYACAAERDSVLPMVKSIKGINVGFLNYTYGTNGIEVQGKVVVDYIDKEKIKRDIANTRQAGAELVCVAIHWGDEYKLLPNAWQKSMANFLISEGVDMVIGGHPHVIQPMEMRVNDQGRNQLLIYSLGNFISDMKTRDTRGGALAEVYISRDSQGVAQVDSAAYRLVFTIPGVPGKSNFRVVDADSCDSQQWRPACNQFSQAATSIFDGHNVAVPRRR